jgi:NAD(P)H dehydrogenase (quinone)
MSLVITGATGHLGRLVVENLLDRGVPAGQIVAGGRSLDRLAPLAERGVQVRRIDYADAGSLTAALDGASKVLLVSGNEFGLRVQQHTAVAEAALAAGVELLAYTSAPFADTTTMKLAAEHAATEAAIRQIGVPFTLLRNGWYFENYTAQIPGYLELGAVMGSAGEGRISAAARADFAAAAAEVLVSDGHAGKAYELGGDTSFNLGELAALVAELSGKPVVYRDLPLAEFAAALEATGMPADFAAVYADVDRSIRAGELLIESGDLSRLIGRPTSPLSDAVAAALS